MKITFLGTGTSQGIPMIGCDCPVCLSPDKKDKRLRSSIYVEWDDFSLVVDTGPDFRQQMLRASIRKLDAVLYTHEHTDHVAGLDDIRAFNFFQKKPMDLFASDHTANDLRRRFGYAFGNYPGVPSIRLHEINDDEFILGGKSIQPVPIMHRDLQVFGFRFGNFTYITDANYISPEAEKLIAGSHTLVLNALRRDKHYSHFNLEEALEQIERLSPKKAYLTHISHQLGKDADLKVELPEGVELAYDGLELFFPD